MQDQKSIPKAKFKLKGLMKLLKNEILEYGDQQFAALGDTYRVKIGAENLIFTRDPNWIKQVLQTNQRNYRKDRAYKVLAMALGKGLLSSEGEMWKKQRKLIQPAFHKKRLAGLLNTMNEVIQTHLARWKTMQGQEIDLDQELLHATSDIVIATLLGASIRSKIPHMAESIAKMQELIVKLIRIPLYKHFATITGERKRFDQLRAKFDEAIYAIIQERKASNTVYDDLLGMLMEAKEEETGECMSDEQLRDEFITIFVAGHETTAFALTWTFYLLGQNPTAYKKLKAASNALNMEAVTLETWHKMTYATAVLKEGMRLYPPAYFVGREAIEKDNIEGYDIQPNENILMSFYGLHRDGKHWKNPLEFNPERFLGEKMSDNERNNYYPFGAGPRMCIGNNFAMMEASLLMTAFFQNLDFKLVEGQKIALEPLVTLRPKYGLKVRL